MMILFCGHNRLFVNFNSAIDSFSLPDLRDEISKDSQLNYIKSICKFYKLWVTKIQTVG